MANEQNLKRGNPATEFNSRTAVEAQKKSAQSRKRNTTLRKLGLQMLQTQIEVDEDTLESVKRLGFETDTPEVQMILLAKLGAIALHNDPDLTMRATQLLMEITGNDVRSINAAEQREIERERLAMEREKVESANKRDGDVPVLIDRRPEE